MPATLGVGLLGGFDYTQSAERESPFSLDTSIKPVEASN